MLSTTREASNSRSLNGIISLEDGQGTIIEDGVIRANSIEITQQMQIDGNLLCENLIASDTIECLDLEADGDITCDNINITTNLTSAAGNIGSLTANNLAVGAIADVEDAIENKLDTSVYDARVTAVDDAINLKLDKIEFDFRVIANNDEFAAIQNELNIIDNTLITKAGLISNNAYTGTNTYSGANTYSGINTYSGTNTFSNKTTFFSSNYIYDPILGPYYISAIEIKNEVGGATQDTTPLCLIEGTSTKVALHISEGDVSITDKLILGTISDVETEINNKLDTSTYNAGVITINDAIDLKLDASTYNSAIDLKANKTQGEHFVSLKDPTGDSYRFSDWSARTGGALVKIQGTASQIALGVYTGVMTLGSLLNVESSINAALSRANQAFTGTFEVGSSTSTVINSTTTTINGNSQLYQTAIGSAATPKNLTMYGDIVMVNVNSSEGRSQLIFNEAGTNNCRISSTAFTSTNVTSRCMNFEILASQLAEGFRFCQSTTQLFRIDAQGNTNTTGHHVFKASGSNNSGILGNGQTTTYCTDTQIQFRYKTATGFIKTKTFNWD